MVWQLENTTIMNKGHQEEMLTLKVSYYSSYKEFKLMGNLKFWPFFICFILLIASGLFTGDSSTTVFLLFFSIFIGFFCVFVTRFYANSILSVSKDGLKLIQGDKTVSFSWSNISNIAFLTPRHGHSYLEIILTIYTKNNSVEYIFIDSLFFITAKSRVKKIQPAIEKYIENYKAIIQLSDFEPILLKKELGTPNIGEEIKW
jgi:hypothetical protein